MLNRAAMVSEVRKNILPFWQGLTDDSCGGYYGLSDFHGVIHENADKGSILYTRILWTFSCAYRLFKDESYRQSAEHARSFITSHSAYTRSASITVPRARFRRWIRHWCFSR